MLDFEAELNKLLYAESEALLQYEFAPMFEAAALGQNLLDDLNKNQADVSLQVEEIYDLIKDQDTKVLQELITAEKTLSYNLAYTAISLCDLLEDFCAFARQSGNEELKHQADILWSQSAQLLVSNNIIRFGGEGQLVNPQIHTVQKAVKSDLPCEQVIEVLQSGYSYNNAIVRKAAVVVSLGSGEPLEQSEPLYKEESTVNEQNNGGENDSE
ncbi:MAG: hypothetical protein Ta2F_15580 [Termitinemataceae bacterium]|nr:MAG: hypothetical protein Ta2F_15580 [Termitinemataceae bacterium]